MATRIPQKQLIAVSHRESYYEWLISTIHAIRFSEVRT